MFKSVEFGSLVGDRNYYLLTDSDFNCEISMRCGMCIVSPVALEYKRRGLPVVSNIVLLYLSYRQRGGHRVENIIKYAEAHALYIDKNHPELKYGTKYFPCIQRKLAAYKEKRK